MDKLWTIIKHEYTRHVLRWRFLLVLLSLPLYLLFAVGIAFFAILLQADRTPVGYVDPDGLIQTHLSRQDNPSTSFFQIEFRAFPGEPEARAALEAEQIQAYYVLPPGYPHEQDVQLYYLNQPDPAVRIQFVALLRLNLLAGQPAEVRRRIIQGPELVLRAIQEESQASENDWGRMLAPFLASAFLLTSVFSTSGYLMQAVVEEKENRMMEILASSASPGQIMSAKIIALICVGLTQVFFWVIVPLLAVLYASANLPFASMKIEWRSIGLMMITVLPTFVLISSLMAALGATVTESREGQQITSLITLPVMIPYMLGTVIMSKPDGPVALAFSFFPLTASQTLLMRLGFGSVPDWQVYLATAILIVSATGAVWLAGRLFRAGMLRYGKQMNWKEILQAAFTRKKETA